MDKKADEATVELIVAREELETLREEKKSVEKSIEAIKSELILFLKTAKQQRQLSSGDGLWMGSGVTMVDEQSRVLKMLNAEIETKRREIDELREKSQRYVDEFKNDTNTYQAEISSLKGQKEQLNGQLMILTAKLNEINGELADTNRQLELGRTDMERMIKNKEKETKSLREVEATLAEKRLVNIHLFFTIFKCFMRICL